jgi:hypothetical protein
MNYYNGFIIPASKNMCSGDVEKVVHQKTFNLLSPLESGKEEKYARVQLQQPVPPPPPDSRFKFKGL